MSIPSKGNQAQQYFRSPSKPPERLEGMSSPFIPFTPMGLCGEPLCSSDQTVSTTPTPFNSELEDCSGLQGQCYPCKQNIPLFLCSGLVRGQWERMRSVCSGIKEGPAAAFGTTKGRVSCLLLVLFLGRLRVREGRKSV